LLFLYRTAIRWRYVLLSVHLRSSENECCGHGSVSEMVALNPNDGGRMRREKERGELGTVLAILPAVIP
jgi:hypothetical protein